MAVGTTLEHYKRTVDSVPIEGKTVLVRVDYNVPLDDKGAITDDFRICQSLETIQYLQKKNCRIILCSHLGRPDGKRDEAYSLEPVAKHLVELLKQPVKFVDDCVGDKVKQAVKRLRPKEVLLLENLRFHAGEEANDLQFAKQLYQAVRADYFVQDGFGTAHRKHASYDAITQLIPSVAGRLLVREFNTITKAMSSAQHPLVAVLGGAKISDKIKVIERLVDQADALIIGGAMANTFLRYKGVNIGASKAEDSVDAIIDDIYKRAQQKTTNVDDFIILPVDVAVAKEVNGDKERKEVSVTDVADDDKIVDIGSKSIERATALIATAKTVLWNGTMGIAEYEQFAHGSARIALEIARHDDEIMSIVGGGDTADFVLDWSSDGSGFDHVSTGGGASIELMSGKKLPGIEALLDA